MGKEYNDYYTYAYLREDKTPYYIGKGRGNRIYSAHRTIKPPKNKSLILFLKKNLTEAEAFKHEIYMIFVLGRKDLGTGILRNRTNGGEGSSGAVQSEETKKKISKANSGKTLTEETKKKIREAMLGTTQTAETKQKIREKALGRKRPNITGENHHFYGKRRPGISQRMSGKNNPMAGVTREKNSNSKAVEVTSPDGTKKEYPSIADVADKLKCHRDSVSRWITTGVSPSRGDLKKFKFKFVDQS